MTRGAFVVIQKDNEILLVRPPDWVSQFSGHWNFPGGVVNDEESLEDGAKREAFEETSIICEVKELLATDYNERSNTSIAIFRAQYVSGDIKIEEREISDARWFTVEDALNQPLAFDIRKVVERWIRT